nr:STK_08120 family protein [Sulfolobus islandicus]
MELYGQDYDEKLIPIFADPKFLLTSLLGANIQVNNGFFEGKIVNYGIHGRVFISYGVVTYIIFIKDKGGKIRVTASKGKILIDIDLSIPLEILNSGLIRRKIDDFKKKAYELIRLERIMRKI